MAGDSASGFYATPSVLALSCTLSKQFRHSKRLWRRLAWVKNSGKIKNFRFTVTKSVSISPVTKVQIRITSTVSSVTVLFMLWEPVVEVISILRKADTKTALTVRSRIKKKIMDILPENIVN